MSRSGSSLADWQDIYNAVNERRKSVMNWLGTGDLIQVVQSKNHVTNGDASGLVGKIPVGSFCDPSTPLTFQTWNDASDTGSQPNGVNSLGSGSPAAICRYVPEYGSFPGFNGLGYWSSGTGGYLAGAGWFLDWIDDALGEMTKAASALTPSCIQHWCNLQWDSATGAVWDGIISDYIPGLTISSYADLWTYATQHLHEISGYSYIDAMIGTSSDTVEIKYSSWSVPHPGVIPADLTLYYSATGDNLGYTPTNYAQSGGPYVHGYATVTKSNASSASPLTFGFTSSVIPSVTPAPGYYVQETLDNFYAVWDFSNYFQY